jgi:hypothetical protein
MEQEIIEKEVERVIWRYEQMLGSVDSLSKTGGEPREIFKMIIRESLQDVIKKVKH